MASYTNEIQILHFSDLHFGKHHICNPEDPTATGDGIPTLAEIVAMDLQTDFGAIFSDKKKYAFNEENATDIIKEPSLIIAVSGDFTQHAAYEEFQQSISFLETLISKPLLNQSITKEDIFLIPGNHDVQFDKQSISERFQQYCAFYNEFFDKTNRNPIFPNQALNITQIHKVERDGNKILIAEVNCCMYVQNDTVDKSRGQVSQAAIDKLRLELEQLSANSDFDDYIKIAMIHHHVVLLPSFIEVNRGVDSVMNARHLLELLSEFNFHLILHGHKHYPQIFTYDPLPLWAMSENRIPQLVIAGGSCGSNELPSEASGSCNTYGVITIKWHPEAKQARIRVITRGLIRKGPKGSLTPGRWKWETVNVSDKVVTPYKTLPNIGASEIRNWDSDKRQERYQTFRYQMAVVEVMPSLIPGQAYEARAWILQHGPDLPAGKMLKTVEWTAGAKFPKRICTRQENPNFCVAYHYWGPMQIEAKLIFEDGYEALTYVYARMPKNEIT